METTRHRRTNETVAIASPTNSRLMEIGTPRILLIILYSIPHMYVL